MQKAFVVLDKSIPVFASAVQGIASIFKSKPEIKATTLIMGVPAWTLVASTVLFAAWTKYTIGALQTKIHEHEWQSEEQKRQMKEQKRQNDELKRRFDEQERQIKVLEEMIRSRESTI